MRWKKNSLKNARLYLILDTEVCDYSRLFEILKDSLRSGVDIVQLRDKRGSAKDILQFSLAAAKLINGRIPYVINDRVDLALISGCAGVHLGQEDIPLRTARKILGSRTLIGVSCQNLEQARKAQSEGADYVGFGSVFKTLTKPQRQPMELSLLNKVGSSVKIPVFAIGGINAQNAKGLRMRGVERIAVCRDICLAKDVSAAVRDLQGMFKS